MGGPGDIVLPCDVELPAQLAQTAAALGVQWPTSSERGLGRIAITYLSIADHCRRAQELVGGSGAVVLAANRSPALSRFALMHSQMAGATIPAHMITSAAATAAIGCAYAGAAALVGLMKLRILLILARAAAFLAGIAFTSAAPPIPAVLAAIDRIGQAAVDAATEVVDEGVETLDQLLRSAATLAEFYCSVAVPRLRGRPADIDRSAVQTSPSRRPNPKHAAKGEVEERPRAPADLQRKLALQSDAAEILARAGYEVTNLAEVPGRKSPDYVVEGRTFECYSPTTDSLDTIRTRIKAKLSQSDRQVIYLADTTTTPAAVRAHLRRVPVRGLTELIAIDRNGHVVPIYP